MKQILPLSAGMFALGLDAYVLSGVLGDVAGSLRVSVADAGQMVTVFTLAYALLSPMLAAVTAAWPRRRVLLVALAVFSAANVASAAAPSLAVLLVARVVAGAAAGLYSPNAAASAAALVDESQRARALSLSLGGLLAATVLGVPVGTLIGHAFGWRATMALVVVLGVAAAGAIAAYLPEVDSPPPPSVRARLTTIADRRVAPLVSVMLLGATASLGLYTYLGTVLQQTNGVATGLLPVYLLGWGVATVLGNVAAGRLVDRGRSPLTLLGAGFALLTVALAVLPLAGVASVPVVLVAFGLAGGSAQVPLQHRLIAVAGRRAPVAISLLSSAQYLGAAIGSALGAAALHASGTDVLGPLAAIPAALALGLTAALAVRSAVATSRTAPRSRRRSPAARRCA